MVDECNGLGVKIFAYISQILTRTQRHTFPLPCNCTFKYAKTFKELKGGARLRNALDCIVRHGMHACA